MEKTKTKFGIKEVACLGMFIALAYAVMALSKLIPINVAGFLTFDFKDFVIAICGFLFGAIPAVIVSIIVSLIEMVTISTTGPIGLLMNVLSTCAFVVPAALFYRSRRKFSNAVIGLILGIVCMAVVMVLWNWLITPLYMGVARSAVEDMLIPMFLPFNLLKAGLNSALVLVLYKPLVTALRKANLAPSKVQSSSTGNKTGVMILGLILLATCILLLLVFQGKI